MAGDMFTPRLAVHSISGAARALVTINFHDEAQSSDNTFACCQQSSESPFMVAIHGGWELLSQRIRSKFQMGILRKETNKQAFQRIYISCITYYVSH